MNKIKLLIADKLSSVGLDWLKQQSDVGARLGVTDQ